MSHFNVAVFHKTGQSVDDLLAPYSELIKVEPYILFTRQEAINYVRECFRVDDHLSDDECWEMEAEGEETDDDGNIYSTYNPKSKWDYYEVGGRWGTFLQDHDPSIIDANLAPRTTVKVGDYSFGPDVDTGKEFITYAVLTPDGEWHECGAMAWFNLSSATEEERNDWDKNYKARFIDTADPDWLLTIVDCHI